MIYIYIHGKLGVTKDESLGTEYLKLVASAGHLKAIKTLQKFF